MKGVMKLRMFAKDLKGKTITDLIEALYFIEVEDENKLEVFAMVNSYEPYTDRWNPEAHQQEPPTRDNAVSFLMMKDMENKYEPLKMEVDYSKCMKSLFVCVRLIAKGVKHPPFPD